MKNDRKTLIAYGTRSTVDTKTITLRALGHHTLLPEVVF